MKAWGDRDFRGDCDKVVSSGGIEFNPLMPKNRKVPKVEKYILIRGSKVDGVGLFLELFRALRKPFLA